MYVGTSADEPTKGTTAPKWCSCDVTLHKKWSFTLQIFSVNVTKSAGSTIGAVLWGNLANDRKNPDSLNIFKHKI